MTLNELKLKFWTAIAVITIARLFEVVSRREIIPVAYQPNEISDVPSRMSCSYFCGG